MATKRKKLVTSGPASIGPDDVIELDTTCPEGVPPEIWAEEMKRQEAYIAEWKAGVIKHIRDYDRTVAAKKAKKKATAKRAKGQSESAANPAGRI